MGFSTTSSHAIWVMAILLAGGTFTDTWFDQQDTLERSREAKRAIDAERLHARITGDWCYDGNIVANLTNAGTVALNATLVTFVADGEPVTDFVVENLRALGSHVWLPDDRVYFNRSHASNPDSLVVFTQHGAMHNVTKTECRYLATIVLTPTSANVLGGATQAFTATGYDQFGDPFTAVYAWSTTTGSIESTGDASSLLTAGYSAGTTWVVTATSGAASESATITVRLNVHVYATETFNAAGAPSNVFNRSEVAQTRVTVRDHGGNLVPNASATLEIRRQSGQVMSNTTAVTNADGVAFFNYTLPANAQPGAWTSTVTVLSGSQLTWLKSSDVDRWGNFTV